MNKGAILIGDNVLDGERFSATPIGDWDGFENIYTPQLHPYASSDSSTAGLVIEKLTNAQKAYGALALLGTDIGLGDSFGLKLAVDRWDNDEWHPVEGHSVYVIEATGAPRSIIILLPPLEYYELSKLRVRWRGPVVPGVKIGHVIAGTAIRNIDLADQGWSIRYVDHSELVRSEGEQIYTSQSTAIVRELSVTSASMSATTAYGAPKAIKQVPLPPSSAELSGPVWYDSQSKSYNVGPGSSGSVIFPDVLTPGKHYRLDYYDHISQVPDGPLPSTSWEPIGINDSLFLRETALTSVIGQAASSDLGVFRNIRDCNSALTIVALREVEPLPPGFGPAPQRSSFHHVVAQHGTTHPVVFLVRPSDPIMGRSTGIYGYLTGPVKIADQSGDLFRTGLTIREAR